MILPPLRWLVLAAAAFLAWIGWLAWLAFTAAHPLVLSRPQFLAADLDVIADVKDANGRPDPKVAVQQVYWSRNSDVKPAAQEITVANLDRCWVWFGPAADQHHRPVPGRYVLPLVRDGDTFRVASIPRSPGFEPAAQDAEPRVYPLEDETLRQLQEIHPAE